MKFNLNKKGFSFSPYLMIFMMFLGIIMAFHFMTVDSNKAVAIASEGKAVKDALQIEGSKSAARNTILLSAYDAEYIAMNRQDLVKITDTESRKLETPEDLKSYLQNKILADLNNIPSTDPDDKTGVGAYDKVKINELDDKGKIRTDGYMVSAEGTHYGVPVKIEKFVDSGVFGYFDKTKGYKDQLLNDLTSAMACRLGVVSCYRSQPYWNLYQPAITCSIPMMGDDQYYAYKDFNPGEDYKDADEVVNRIKQALIDIAKEEVRGKTFTDYKKSDSAVVFNVDYIDAQVSMSSYATQGECCSFIHRDNPGNYCKNDKYNEDYRVSLSVSGKIHFKEFYMIGDATLNEKDGGYQVCAKAPLMLKDGSVKALKFSGGEFDLPYRINLEYMSECPPLPVKKASSSTGNLPEGQWIPGFKINEDSLKFTLESVKCQWDPDSDYKPTCDPGKKLTSEDYKRCGCPGGCYGESGSSATFSGWFLCCPPDPCKSSND